MTKLDFESLEREVNRQNLLKVKHEVINRSSRLRKRIRRFSEQFGVPEEDFWAALEAEPLGPLASTLAREARRQNIHEKHAGGVLVRWL